MTCIVALSVGNKVFLGGDSAASDEKSGLILQTTDSKVFKVGQYGIGFVDSFRHLHTEAKYTYWSNFHKSREKNKGWRIDMMLISDKEKIGAADCLTDYFGSDHCPVLLELK